VRDAGVRVVDVGVLADVEVAPDVELAVGEEGR
jgi:hypothetical protein